jgi:hypothetical protein
LAHAVPAFFCSFSRRAAWHGPTRSLATFFSSRRFTVGDVLSRDILSRDILKRDVLSRDILKRDVLSRNV